LAEDCLLASFVGGPLTRKPTHKSAISVTKFDPLLTLNQPFDNCSARKIKPPLAIAWIVNYEESISMLSFGLRDMVLTDNKLQIKTNRLGL
jgi:hypothetical protein